jgi:single-stranded DNA-binding protein
MSLYATGIIRIISDPQLRAFESGTMVANFAGGIQEGKDKDGNWINNAIDCEVWGKSAEVIVDKLKKGDSILASGAVRRQEWSTRLTPELQQACAQYPEVAKLIEKRSKHVLSVQRFEFMPRAAATTSEEAVF